MKQKLLFPFLLLVVQLCFSQSDIYEVCRTGTVADIETIHKTSPELLTKKNKRGYSPLTIACYSGNEDVVKFIINHTSGFNDMSSFGSPLMAATYKGYDKIVGLLLTANANPNLADSNGTTAAHYAIMNKNYIIISLLHDAKANFSLQNNVGKSPLDIAFAINDEKINKLLNL